MIVHLINLLCAPYSYRIGRNGKNSIRRCLRSALIDVPARMKSATVKEAWGLLKDARLAAAGKPPKCSPPGFSKDWNFKRTWK